MYNDNIISKINDIVSRPKISDEPDCSRVLGNVWLGNHVTSGDALFVNFQKITRIINVTVEIPNKLVGIKYTNLLMSEKENCNETFGKALHVGADIIHYETINYRNILVHCKRGHHRSASIIAFYLMKYHGMSVVDAISYVKRYRPNSFRRITCMVKYMINYDINRYHHS